MSTRHQHWSVSDPVLFQGPSTALPKTRPVSSASSDSTVSSLPLKNSNKSLTSSKFLHVVITQCFLPGFNTDVRTKDFSVAVLVYVRNYYTTVPL